MLAEQSLHEGRLQEALTQLQDQVRGNPTNIKHRLFLFQLLAVLGQWDRALTQLKVIGDMSSDNFVMVQTYHQILHCEQARAEVFAGRRSPLLFGEPEQWLALLMEALHLGIQGHYAEAGQISAQAFAAAPATSGSIDGQRFAWIADADTRLGPILEAIVNGRYYWIPFHRIRTIEIQAPSDLRDLVWLLARFTWANGGEASGMIPTRYPGSETSEDNLLRMARKTTWTEYEGELSLGLGQKLLATDINDYPLLDIRYITLDSGGSTPHSSPNDN